MITELDIEKILELFKKYFDNISYNQGRLENPSYSITNISNTSETLSNFSKYQKFYDNVIAQPLYDTDASRSIFELVGQSLASNKTILYDLENISNPFKVNSDLLDNLIKSFGFPFVNFNEYTKRQILLNLIKNYKIKGSLTSVRNMLDIIINGRIDVNELLFEKDKNEAYFIEYIKDSVPGNNNIITPIKVEIEKHTRLDPHWYLESEELINYKVNRAMSPYFNVNLFINSQSNISAIDILRTKAVQDYNLYKEDKANGDMTDYNNTHTIKIDLLPDPLNYLDIYEFIRYIYITSNGLNNEIEDDPNKNTYTFNPVDTDGDIIVDELNNQFNTRYCNDFGTIKSKISECKFESFLQQIPAVNYPLQAESSMLKIDNLTGASITYTANKMVILGGKFKDTNEFNTNLYINDSYAFNNPVFKIDIGLKLIDAIVTPGVACNSICITGGYDENGEKNYKTYIFNLATHSLTRIMDIDKSVWMKDPYVVTTQTITYLISRSDEDNCKGSIYIWNICKNYKKLLALIDPNDYDLSTVQASVDNKNRLFISIKSKLSHGTRILMLDPDPRYELFLDLTELLIKRIHGTKRYEFAKLMKNNQPMIYAEGDYLYLVYEDQITNLPIYHTFKITYDISDNIKEKIVPKYISGMLIPSRISKPCYEYENSIIANQDFCGLDFSNYGLEFVDIEKATAPNGPDKTKNKCLEGPKKLLYEHLNYDKDVIYDLDNTFGKSYFFIDVKNKHTKEIAYYWPLIKQLEITCCESPELRISYNVRGFGGDYYDTSWKYDFDFELGMGHPVYGKIEEMGEYCSKTFDIQPRSFNYDKDKKYDRKIDPYYFATDVCDINMDINQNYISKTKWTESCYFYFNIDKKLESIGSRIKVGSYTFEHVFAIHHDQHENNHYSYMIYDAVSDYDIENIISIVSLSAYPDYDLTNPKITQPGFLDKIRDLYDIKEIPEYIRILSDVYKQYNMLEGNDGDLSENCNRIFTNETNRSKIILCEKDDGTYINIVTLYPRILKILSTCKLEYFPSTKPTDPNLTQQEICRQYFARDFRKDMLDERINKIETDHDDLPMFNNYEELSNFLHDISPNNKLTIDSSINPGEILYNLLIAASQLFGDANLNLLQPDTLFNNIMAVTDLFKPYYSRLLIISPFIEIADPIGDWIAMEDSVNFNYFKRMVSNIYMDDCPFYKISEIEKEHINIHEILHKKLNYDLNYQHEILHTSDSEKFGVELKFKEEKLNITSIKYDRHAVFDIKNNLNSIVYDDYDIIIHAPFRYDNGFKYDSYGFAQIET